MQSRIIFSIKPESGSVPFLKVLPVFVPAAALLSNYGERLERPCPCTPANACNTPAACPPTPLDPRHDGKLLPRGNKNIFPAARAPASAKRETRRADPLEARSRQGPLNRRNSSSTHTGAFSPRFFQPVSTVCLAGMLVSGARRTLTGNHAGRAIAPGVISGPDTHGDGHYPARGFAGPS